MISEIIVWSTSSDSAPLWLLAAGPAGALATYWSLYRYYRNTDKTHQYERDTLVNAQPVMGGEEKIDHIRKTQKSEIKGNNSSSFRTRVERLN